MNLFRAVHLPSPNQPYTRLREREIPPQQCNMFYEPCIPGGRSPPRGRKVIWNQWRKIFCSPSPNRPYTCCMTKQNARCANTDMTQIPVTEVAVPAPARRADSVTSNARRARAPQHFVPWGIEGGYPPPPFSANKTNNSGRTFNVGGAPSQFPEVRMGTLRFRPRGVNRPARSVNGVPR